MKEIFYPTNKFLLLEEIKEDSKKEKKETSILLPEDYKEEELKPFGTYRVLNVTHGSTFQHLKGKKVIVENHMVQKIKSNKQEILLIQENHILGFFLEEN